MKRRILLSAIFILSGIGIANAQFIEDALRYANPNGINSARVGALGVSFNGISDDFNATNFNPAGLSLLVKTEFNMGLDFQNNSNDVNFMDQKSSYSSSNFNFSQIGMVFPYKLAQRNAALSIGYIQESNFSNKYEYIGFNPGISYTAYQAKYGTRNYQDNWAYHIYLADNQLYTPVKDSLQQSAFIAESGGLHNFSVGGAIDINSYLSVGASISYKWANYKYMRDFTEKDIINKYTKPDTLFFQTSDVSKVNIRDSINQSASGISGSIGVLGKVSNFMRFGATIKFPSYYSIKEDFLIYAESFFKSGMNPAPYDPDYKSSDYYITTPFVYSGGLSVNFSGLTLSGGIEYMNAAKISLALPDGFLITNPEIYNYFQNLNNTINSSLVGQLTWGLGFEYELPEAPIAVRGSYQSVSSPYKDNIDGANRQNIGLGVGIYTSEKLRFDLLYRWTSYSQLRTNYGTQETGSLYILKQTPSNIALQMTYRY